MINLGCGVIFLQRCLLIFIGDFSPPGLTAAVEVTVAELVASAAEMEASDADWVAVCMSVAALTYPSAVAGVLGSGDGSVGAAVDDNAEAEDEGVWLSQLSVDWLAPELNLR